MTKFDGEAEIARQKWQKIAQQFQIALQIMRLVTIENHYMLHLIANWFLSALSLLIVAAIVPGIEVAGFGTSLIAAIVIGLVNATLGFVLKILTFPLTLVTFGAFLIVINA